MKRFSIALVVLGLTAGASAFADGLDDSIDGDRTTISPADVTATPEMWFYQQELLRRENPRTAVREKSELRAAQRMSRLASMRWFGFSNTRPTANPDCVHGPYSPRWVSNGYMPSEWTGVGNSTVIHSASRSVHRY